MNGPFLLIYIIVYYVFQTNIHLVYSSNKTYNLKDSENKLKSEENLRSLVTCTPPKLEFLGGCYYCSTLTFNSKNYYNDGLCVSDCNNYRGSL